MPTPTVKSQAPKLKLVCDTSLGYFAAVRKRIVIGAVAAIVVGVAAYVVSQPKKGTVEWHKREYQNARVLGLGDEIVRSYGSGEAKRARRKTKEAQIEYHQQALIRLGYLKERVVTVQNRSAFDIVDEVIEIVGTNEMAGDGGDFFAIGKTETNMVTLIGVEIEVRFWEDLIRKADVAKSR